MLWTLSRNPSPGSEGSTNVSRRQGIDGPHAEKFAHILAFDPCSYYIGTFAYAFGRSLIEYYVRLDSESNRRPLHCIDICHLVTVCGYCEILLRFVLS